MLSVTPEQHAVLSRAAFIELRPLSQFLMFHGLAAAKQTFNKEGFDCL
jgi:uncharacterized protein (DUF1778 family)